jgi:formylglycine-generating enzyme required for sulfatase activity
MEFTRITAGTFMMGDDPSKYPAKIWHPNDVPQHKVAITRDFFIGTYEVTQAQWEKVMGTNPSYDKGRDKPITGMTFEEVRDFIGRLNKMDGAMAYRLPTEAEWEYAARAGTETPWFFGETPEELEKYAWASYYVKGQRPVGRKLPNPWGLFDVHGNVSELVSDYYSQDYYSHSPERDPTGPEPENGGSLVVRGGSWNDLLDRTRSSHRDFLEAGKRGENIGLRLAFTSIPDKAD